MINVGKSILVIVNWRADYARTYLHVKDDAVCLTCAAVLADESALPYAPQRYSDACRQADHRKRQVQHVTATETAPEEAKRASRLYGRLHRRFGKLGYSCGDAIFLLGADAPLEESKAELRAEFLAANAGFTHCKVDFDLKQIVLVPGEINEETMGSIRRDVEATIQKLLDALRAADLKAIKSGAKEARSLAAILDADGRAQAEALAGFAQGVAKRLREAADESTLAVELAVEEARSGAARFAAILFEEAPADGERAAA